MFDRGLNLTLRAVRRRIVAMPHDLYPIRLIHDQTRRALPGERLWTAAQLIHPAALRFLRNAQPGRLYCNVYIQPTSSPTRRIAILPMFWWIWITATSRSSRPCAPMAWHPA